MRLCLSVLTLLLLGIAVQPSQLRAQAQDGVIIFLVRHAERADDGGMAAEDDPHLSEAGQGRGRQLAEMLKNAGLTHIHSSDYIRTRETAAPAATAAGLAVASYDVRALEEFAKELLSTPGRHLVVGHSNSTPNLVAALGGDPHGEIETMEYDRLYLLSIGIEGVSTVLLRFGEPFRLSRHPNP